MRRTLALNLPLLVKEDFLMEPDAAKMVGQATQQIITRGSYLTESGTEHEISADLALARAQTITYAPDLPIPPGKAKYTQASTASNLATSSLGSPGLMVGPPSSASNTPMMDTTGGKSSEASEERSAGRRQGPQMAVQLSADNR